MTKNVCLLALGVAVILALALLTWRELLLAAVCASSLALGRLIGQSLR